MKKSIKILTEARALLAKPNGWIQHVYQKRNSYCALGALNKIAFNNNTTPNLDAYWTAKLTLRWAMNKNITAFNDKSTKNDVLAAFDKAITHLEAIKKEDNLERRNFLWNIIGA